MIVLIVACALAYLVIVAFALALCRAAGDGDRALEEGWR